MVVEDIEYTDINRIICESAKDFGPKNFVESVEGQKCISFAEMDRQSGKFANFLKSRGVQKDDTISLVGRNSLETVIILFGILRYGAIANPINSEESDENICRLISRVRAKIVLYDSEKKLAQKAGSISWIPFSNVCVQTRGENELFDFVSKYDPHFENQLGSKDSIAEVLFTSGTTEMPKAVLVSREGLFYMVEEVIDKLRISTNDRLLEYRAYSWASTQLLSILLCMRAGATLILAEKFSRSRFSQWLREYGITISAGVPTVINMLVEDPVALRKEDVPELRFITSSSAPLTIEKWQAFECIYGIKINQMAGMTEAGWMMGNPPEKRKLGSVGTPFKYKDVFIVNEEGSKCNAGVEGQVVVKGKSMGIGYLRDDGGVDEFSSNGFYTGDLGYIDEEGYVFLTGRRKELIIRGGVNISPLEISKCLMGIPDIKEVVTLGIPDTIYGEEIACFIVKKARCTLNEKDVMKYCKNRLPEFKHPKKIVFVKAIPRTDRGKIEKNNLLMRTR